MNFPQPAARNPRYSPLTACVAPGITGLTQISQAYDQSVDDVRKKVAYDLEYIAHRSMAQDFKIMLRIVPVMLKRGTI